MKPPSTQGGSSTADFRGRPGTCFNRNFPCMPLAMRASYLQGFQPLQDLFPPTHDLLITVVVDGSHVDIGELGLPSFHLIPHLMEDLGTLADLAVLADVLVALSTLQQQHQLLQPGALVGQGHIHDGEGPLLAQALNEHLAPLRDRRRDIQGRPGYIQEVLAAGLKKASRKAKGTMRLVRRAMRIDY